MQFHEFRQKLVNSDVTNAKALDYFRPTALLTPLVSSGVLFCDPKRGTLKMQCGFCGCGVDVVVVVTGVGSKLECVRVCAEAVGHGAQELYPCTGTRVKPPYTALPLNAGYIL